jgi:hypothetical protein
MKKEEDDPTFTERIRPVEEVALPKEGPKAATML